MVLLHRRDIGKGSRKATGPRRIRDMRKALRRRGGICGIACDRMRSGIRSFAGRRCRRARFGLIGMLSAMGTAMYTSTRGGAMKMIVIEVDNKKRSGFGRSTF